MSIRSLVIVAAGGTFIASTASAQSVRSYQSSGGPFDISDALGPTVITIDVPSGKDDLIASFTEITLVGFSHTWAGDVTVTLEHGGTTVTMLDRPGVPESTFGDSANFNGDDYRWTDDGLVYDTDLFGTDVPSDGVFSPVGGSFDEYVGMDKSGLWTLTISDAAGGDDGMIGGFRIVVNNFLGCPGDVSGPAGVPDGRVDNIDLIQVLADWGRCPDLPAECPSDVDGDGFVGLTELLAVLSGWGPCPG